jgi:signal transduction histidine kinase
MINLLITKVGRSFLAIFFIFSLPLIAACWFGLRSATKALQSQTHLVLRTASNGAEAQLREFLLHLKQFTLALSANPRIREALETPDRSNTNIFEILKSEQASLPEAQEIFVLAADGRVFDSSKNENIGQDRHFAEFFTQGRETFFPGDIHRDRTNGQISWIMAAPITEPSSQRFLGVLAVRIDPTALSALITGRRILQEGADTQSFRIGNTGETYIVNRNHLMITESRGIPDSILKVRVDTLPVRAALERGVEISGDYNDYRGVPVSGASIILRERNWVVLTEIDFSQAFAPIRRLRILLIGLAAGLGLASLIVAGFWTRGIVRPLRTVNEADGALAAGYEAGIIVPEQNLPANEIGEFVRKRNIRVQALVERQRELVLEQKRRAEASAELARMSYSMVHDMRAPLRAIISFGGMLEAEAGDCINDEAREYLKRMRNAATRMDHLIRDMLRYSALVQEELPLESISISKLMHGIIETYPVLQAHKSQICVAAELPDVRGNEATLTQCFSSLLDNAVKYARPDQTLKINIKAEMRGDMVRIYVEDNGVGIPTDSQEKIFDIFQRGSNAQDGTGIGLAVARIAAQRMGGGVGVISELGKGSQFWVELRAAG